ncbi:MAG: DNA-processing protein DprA [Nitriliruptoraceae bacterium]
MSIQQLPASPDHDRHVLTVALAARLPGRSDLRPLSPTRFWAALEELGGDLQAASTSEDLELRLLAARTAAAALHASELESQSITLLTPFHPRYPSRYLERLGTTAPPLLYVAGDPALLADPERDRLAVVGSRDATEVELDAARAAAETAADHGWDVVSGGAKGVDAVALNAAIAHGGTVIALLTDGVRRALRKGALRRLVSDGQAILAAPVHPDAGFTVGNAMARNRLIYALADLTYVAAVVEGEGGTWSGATEALRRRYGRVAVNPDANAAVALQRLGAQPAATADGLLDLARQPPEPPLPRLASDPASQTSLFE